MEKIAKTDVHRQSLRTSISIPSSLSPGSDASKSSPNTKVGRYTCHVWEKLVNSCIDAPSMHLGLIFSFSYHVSLHLSFYLNLTKTLEFINS